MLSEYTKKDSYYDNEQQSGFNQSISKDYVDKDSENSHSITENSPTHSINTSYAMKKIESSASLAYSV